MFELKMEVSVDGRKGSAATQHIIKSINNFSLELNDLSIETLERLVQETYNDIGNNFPGTGKVLSDIHMENYGEGHLEIWTDNQVVWFLEYGTKAHGPVKAKFLVFEINGVKIFTLWVKGIDPFYTITFALDRLAQKIGAIE